MTARSPASAALAAFTAEASRTTSALRFGLVAVLALTAALDVTRAEGVGFWVVLGVYLLFAVGWFALVTRRPVRARTGLVSTAVDLAAVTVLALLAGGGGTLPSLGYVYVPVVCAFRYLPRLSALVTVATVVSFLVTAQVTRTPGAAPRLLAEAAVLVLVGVASTLLSAVLARRSRRVRALLLDADRLTAAAVDAEQSERRRLAEELHDHALQTLIVAGQELDELAADHPGVDVSAADAAVRATVRELREVVFALHPYVLDEAGLAVAVRRVAERAGAQGGVAVDVRAADLPDGTGTHDRLLLGVARELLTNVVRHAGAGHVEVVLAPEPDAVRLEVSDDGRGLGGVDLGARLADGHIGLASTRARVEAVGGSFRVDDARERGTRIVVRVPR